MEYDGNPKDKQRVSASPTVKTVSPQSTSVDHPSFSPIKTSGRPIEQSFLLLIILNEPSLEDAIKILEEICISNELMIIPRYSLAMILQIFFSLSTKKQKLALVFVRIRLKILF